MKTKFNLLLSSILITFFLAACGGGGNSTEQSNSVAQPQAFSTVTVTMLADDEDAEPLNIADVNMNFDADDDPTAFDSFLPVN